MLFGMLVICLMIHLDRIRCIYDDDDDDVFGKMMMCLKEHR